jgi:predicted O-methyltransferase YrrM
MQQVTGELLDRIESYIERLFVAADDTLAQNLRDAEAAGLPAINVSPLQGKLLYLLVRLARATRVLEIGTLAGYSTTWLARALPPSGVVVSLEIDPQHAAIARRNIARSAPGAHVDIRVGPAVESLKTMIEAKEPPFDVIFIDADKTGYVTYLDLSMQLARPGTLILADNVIRHGGVMEAVPPDESARGAKAFNEALAAHPRLESIVLPIVRDVIDGVSISIVTT